MSAIEADGRPQDEVERVATVTALPARKTEAPDPLVVLRQVARTFTPPDIWSDDRPSLRKLDLYGRYGRWTRGDGVARLAGTLYAWLVAFPVHAAGYTVLWIFERPARLLVATTVVGLVYLAF